MVFSYSAHFREKEYEGRTTHDENTSPRFGLSGRVLVLNQSYEPISVCSVKKAIILLFLTKAELIEARQNRAVRSISSQFPFPSVIRLGAYYRVPHKRVELSRKNIVRRDNGRCQYCGTTKLPLTIDHVIPKSRGGGDTWENLVTACVRCNNKKGNRTPEEAGMHLAKSPRRPSYVSFIKDFGDNIDESWKPYIFA